MATAFDFLEEEMKLLDTVAAVSTPRGKGGVALIRISGADALSIGDRIFKRVNGKPLSTAKSASLCRGEIVMPSEKRESVDDGLAAIFRAPSSFTGEDTVEIYCHGGILVTEQVLTCALLAGARAAEAGEFTRRAFISGKLGLSEAEALGGLLEAKSFSQLRLSRNGMRGHLSEQINNIYSTLVSIMSGIYAAIDFPDEDLNEYSREEISAMLCDVHGRLARLSATYKTGRAVSEGIPTVICGRANAGKSSVYNAIVGYDAAIVTDIEGTTRDVLREVATLGSTTLLLCDTAGIRETSDKVESIGIERALSALDESELILAVFDGASAPTPDDYALIDKLQASAKPCIALLNKSDLKQSGEMSSLLSERFEHTLNICARTGEGMDALAARIDTLFIDGSIDMDNDAVLTGARQFASVSNAQELIASAMSEIRLGTPLDLCCIGIESAISALGEVDGREVGEEIVSEIFSKFCVGK